MKKSAMKRNVTKRMLVEMYFNILRVMEVLAKEANDSADELKMGANPMPGSPGIRSLEESKYKRGSIDVKDNGLCFTIKKMELEKRFESRKELYLSAVQLFIALHDRIGISGWPDDIKSLSWDLYYSKEPVTVVANKRNLSRKTIYAMLEKNGFYD